MSKEIELSRFRAEMRDRLDQFAVCAQEICRHFAHDSTKPMGEFLYSLEGVCFSLASSEAVTQQHHHHHHQPAHATRMTNKLFKSINISIEKYEALSQFKKMLNDAKANFELAQKRTLEWTAESDIYFSIMNLLNECISLGDNEDLISSFLYKPAPARYEHASVQEASLVGTSVSSSQKVTDSLSAYASQSSLGFTKSSSNYLLSFYEYCNTLFEYFREKSSVAGSTNSSCFAILNYSPASLICKLLFEDGIKPALIESLTHKLNLNLTAIILHNSCPRLKLTLSRVAEQASLAASLPISAPSVQQCHSSYQKQASTSSNMERKLTVLNTGPWSPSDAQIYNLSAFYLVLNQSDIMCCSRKKPDEFVRDLLFKVKLYLFLIGFSDSEHFSMDCFTHLV